MPAMLALGLLVAGVLIAALSRDSVPLAAAGWQEWTVTSLMPGLYSVNSGFLVRDRVDNSNPAGSQLYDSRNTGTAANRPQLVLAWS